MKWPTKVRRLQTIALNSPQNVSFTKANRMPTSFLLTLTTVKFIFEFLGWQTSDTFLPQIKSSSNHASFNPVCLQSRIRSISTRIKDSPRLVFFSPYVSAETLGGNFWQYIAIHVLKKSDFSLDRCFHPSVCLFFPPDPDSSFSPRVEGSPRFFFSVLYVSIGTWGGNFEQCIAKHRLQKSDLSLDRCFHPYLCLFFPSNSSLTFWPIDFFQILLL